MEIEIKKEGLSNVDSGGAYREAKVYIMVDSSQSPFKQRQSLIYEVLSAHLDPLECNIVLITELAHILTESLEQLEH